MAGTLPGSWRLGPSGTSTKGHIPEPSRHILTKATQVEAQMYLPCGSSQIEPLDPKGMPNYYLFTHSFTDSLTHSFIHPSFIHLLTQKNTNIAQILKGSWVGDGTFCSG